MPIEFQGDILFFVTLKIVFHCLMLSVVASESPVIILLIAPLNRIFFCPSGYLKIFFSLSLVLSHLTTICLTVVLFLCILLGICCAFWIYRFMFLINFRNFVQYLFKYCFYPFFLSFLSGTPIITMLDCLILNIYIIDDILIFFQTFFFSVLQFQ